MKKIVSIVLCIVILGTCLQLSAFAVDEKVYTTTLETIYADSYSDQEVYSFYEPHYYYPFSVGSTKHTSYSVLNELEKVYYDKIVNSKFGQMSFTVDYQPYISSEDFSKIDFGRIMNAVCLDCPELFYNGGCSVRYSRNSSGTKIYQVIYEIRFPKNTSTGETFYDTSKLADYNTQLMNAFESVSVNLDTRYDFVKSVHDYLCDTVTYVNDYTSCHDAYGTLVNKQAVCQGYAEAFKMFCNYYNIPCVCVTGVGVTNSGNAAHMWNAVQMDDGKWYLLDITWDDQYVKFYDFFLVGLYTKDTNFGQKQFSASHLVDDSAYLPSLNYATGKFNSGLKVSGFGATYNSVAQTNAKQLCLSFFDAEYNKVYYNGIYVDVTDYATGTVVSVPSGNNSKTENWQLVLVGDCNGDGFADNDDYSVAVNKVLSDKEITDIYDKACDACNDGTLDVLDLALLERAISGVNTDIKLS